MISHMHFKDMEGVASINKSKKYKYMENENIIIKTNIYMQHIFPTDFEIKRKYRTNYATFPINTLNLKVKVPFSQILPPGLSILMDPFT